MTQRKMALWQGSINTADHVRKVIAKRYGEEEAAKYNPLANCFTFKTWKAKGYFVKKGEKAIRSITFIEEKDPKAKESEKAEVIKYPKTVYLFYIKQVEKKQ